jgi:hypothetical protein
MYPVLERNNAVFTQESTLTVMNGKLRLVDASDDKSFTEAGAFRVVIYNVIIHILHLFYYSDTLKNRLFLSFMDRILIQRIRTHYIISVKYPQ